MGRSGASDSRAVVADRGEPIDELLADRLACGGDAAIAIAKQFVDRKLAVDAPLEALTKLWREVAALDPLLSAT